MTSKEASTRANSVVLSGRFLANRLDYAEIPEHLIDNLLGIVSDRVKDKNANVRKWAVELVFIAHRNILDKNYFMEEHFLLLITHDNNEVIRKFLTQKIEITPNTI